MINIMCNIVLFSSLLRISLMLSHVQLFVTSWTVAHQARLSMGFSKQKYWSGLSFPSPRDLPEPGIKLMSLASPTFAGRFFTTEPPGITHHFVVVQSLSHVWLIVTPWNAACQSSLSFTISLNLLKFMSIKSVISSNHLILCCPPSPLALNLFQHQSLFQWVNSSHQVVHYNVSSLL